MRGFSSSAEIRSAAMPRRFNNNINPSQMMSPSVIGAIPYPGGTGFYQTPLQNPFLIPLTQSQPFGNFGQQPQNMGPSSLASVLGIAAPRGGAPPPIMGQQQGGSRCPTSPFAQFLSKDQQDVLHELIIEARRVGAPEAEVKQYVEKYVKEILPAEKFQAFQEASNDFDRRLTLYRRGKRETGIPRRFDTITFRNRKTKKPPQKLEITDKNELYDFMEVQKDARTLENLIEHP
uniref:Uncharacterized protein n=1 Tax=Panagrolaimus superbus TaxID=310955 RepID=A0A914YAL4_9BILA